MRKILIALAATVLLCGAAPPPPIDLSAIPAAVAARSALAEQELKECPVSRRLHRLYQDRLECFLKPDRLFVAATKITDRNLYRRYETQRRKIARDSDAERVGIEVSVLEEHAWWRFLLAVGQEQNAYMAVRSPHIGPGYDKAALSQAKQQLDGAIRGCEKASKLFNGAIIRCRITAVRRFATSIRMRDMYRVDTFAALLEPGISDLDRDDLAPNPMEIYFADFFNDLFSPMGRDAPTYRPPYSYKLLSQYHEGGNHSR